MLFAILQRKPTVERRFFPLLMSSGSLLSGGEVERMMESNKGVIDIKRGQIKRLEVIEKRLRKTTALSKNSSKSMA